MPRQILDQPAVEAEDPSAAPVDDWGEKILREQLEEYLRLIHRSEGPGVFALWRGETFFHRYVPDLQAIPYAELVSKLKEQGLSLGLVTNPMLPLPADWPQSGQRRVRERNKNKTVTWGASIEHIAEARCTYQDFDNENLSLEEQEKLFAQCGIEPTFTVWSGRRSLQPYFVLEEGQAFTLIEAKEADELLCRIITAKAPELKTDQSLSDASQVMRLPGWLNDKSGNRAYIRSKGGPFYPKETLLELLRDKAKQLGVLEKPEAKQGGSLERRSHPQQSIDEPRIKFPLDEGVSRDHKKLIESGSEPGSNNQDGLALAQDLIGTEQFLIQEGCEPYPTSRELFNTYIENSARRHEVSGAPEPFSHQKAWDRFEWAESGDPLPDPSTPLEILRGRIQHHTEQQKGFEKSKQSAKGKTADPLDPREAADDARRVTERLKEMMEESKRLSAAERSVFISKMPAALGIQPKDLPSVLSSIRTEESGGTYVSFDEIMNDESVVEPLIDNLLASGGLTIIASEPGIGKSAFLYRMAEAVSKGGAFADQFQCREGGVLIIQVDENRQQAKEKWKTMILKPRQSNWHCRFEFNIAQIQDLEDFICENNIRLIMIDSFGALAMRSGRELKDATTSMYLYELNEIAGRTGCAIAVSHHLSKSGAPGAKARGSFREPSLDDVYGSVFNSAASADVWGLRKMTEDEHSDKEQPKYLLKILKSRSCITGSDQLFEFRGDCQDLSFRFEGIDNNPDALVQRALLRDCLIRALQEYRDHEPGGEGLKVDAIHAQINRYHGANFSVASVRNELCRLANQGARTGVCRTKAPSRGKGRASYLYRLDR